MKRLRCYEMLPIDLYWEYLPTVEDVAATLGRYQAESMINEHHPTCLSLEKFLQDVQQAMELARKHYWEGDFKPGYTPRVFWLPNEVEFAYAFVWKQENNGTTYVVSPFELPWLDAYTFRS